MVRVDHAGEFGAQRIYEGQLAVFGGSGNSIESTIKEMAFQESNHLQHFEQLLKKFRVRPTALHPLWDIVGYVVGAGSALLGEKASMALTVAVEDVICEHYDNQLRIMNDLGYRETEEDLELRKLIRKARDDEEEHRDIAFQHKADQMPFYEPFTAVVKVGTRLAIWLSTRI